MSTEDLLPLENEDIRQIFRHPPQLETSRLLLRPLRKEDAADLFSYASDPAVAEYVLWHHHLSLSESKAQIRCARRQYRLGQPGSLALVEKQSGRMIGTIGYMWIDYSARSAEIGYSLSREYWNRGLMTEALEELIRFSFQVLTLNRLEAQHDTRNPASGRVMEKCGMIREGVLRQRLKNKGVYIDTALYSILRREYNKD